MSDEKVSALPTVANALAADIIYAIQGGVSVQETLQQVLDLTQDNFVLNGVGNPNGSVAGVTYQFFYDTGGKKLYICTATGSTTTAVWTLIAANASVVSLTNGQLLIGSTGADPVAATLTAGAGISIANGAGVITISGTGSGIGWVEVSGTSQAMAADTGYVTSNVGLVTLTLPATAAFGTALNVIGKGSGGWIIAQNAGQNIQIGTLSSTIGVGGSVASTNFHDSLQLLCTTADTTWTILGGAQGNLTIV